MRLLHTGSHDPFYNLAFEELAFNALADEPALLIWRNDPAAVVGSYQNICRELAVPALRRLGIPVLRRISGGGTVYHDAGNLNYSLLLPGAAGRDYRSCMEPVIEALNRLGVPAYFDRVCDIAVDGKKISGSAQRSAGGRLLHHGTLLFSSDLTLLEQLTHEGKNPAVDSRGTPSAICRVGNIADYLPRPMPLEEFARSLEELLAPGAAPEPVSPERAAEAERLAAEKYRSWAWTWGRTPPFTYQKEGCFDGAPIRVRYEARRGILSAVELRCPALDEARAEELLTGARLDPEGLAALCGRLAGPERAEELLAYLL